MVSLLVRRPAALKALRQLADLDILTEATGGPEASSAGALDVISD